MKKTFILLMFFILLLTVGCGRGRISENSAAAHLGQPVSIQIIADGFPNITVRGKGNIQPMMEILAKIEVRKLSVDEEINLILVQGKTLNATEMRFKDSRDNVYKALLLDDGSVLVVEGARGSEDRRHIYLSEPGQQEFFSEVRRQLMEA
jgi:hypothetical protein